MTSTYILLQLHVSSPNWCLKNGLFFFRNISSRFPNSKKTILKYNKMSSELKENAPKKLNSKLYAPGEIYLCVLGNGAKYSSRALYMFTDTGRYLFNCGEGTQRQAHEYKMKLSKLEHIFITHKSWENLGGLLGLSLTVQDIGVPAINIHGPTGIDLLYKNAHFANVEQLDIINNDDYESSFVDNCMTVEYIPISIPKMPEPVLPIDENETLDKVAKRWKANEEIKKKLAEAPIEPDMVVAFACKGHNKPGQLLFEKCVEQGVPPGPLLGELKLGKDVTLPCGKIVLSKDVVSPDEPCPVFLVVECPNAYFLDEFLEEEKFKKYQTGTPEPSDLASLVIHFTPPEILKTLKYKEWMERFPPTTTHLIMNSDNATLNSTAVHRIQHKLNVLHPSIFPLLQEKEAVPLDEWGKENVIQAKTLDRFYLRPAKGFDRSLTVKIDPQVFIDEALNTEGFPDCLTNLKICIQESAETTRIYGSPFPDVIFLGTGSCIPSKVRNVSSIIVRVCKYEYFLLDCGEGTLGQLKRMFGDGLNNVLKELLGVFISHMHADHHLGLIQLIKAVAEANKDEFHVISQLFIIGPPKLDHWLRKYDKHVERICDYYFFINSANKEFGYGKYTENGQVKRSSFEDLCICTVPVDHCLDAYAIIMTDKYLKWKLVYSGDTMPCEKLIIAGNNCTLLIHEATMEDELENEACLKKHSTTSQAIEVAEKMKAKHTILTHFSQRYAKIPVINESFNHLPVACAFDNMRASRKEFHILPLLIPALKCLFAESMEEMKTKGDKRRRRQEQMAIDE